MNWMKLKSSIVIVVTLLIINCPVISTAKQFSALFNNASDTIHQYQPTNQLNSACDSLSADQRSAERIISILLLHLPEHDPSYFDSYSAITFHRFRIGLNGSTKPEVAVRNETKTNQNDSSFLYSSETLSHQKHLKPGFNQSENLSAKTEGKDDGPFGQLSARLNDFSLLQTTNALFGKSYLSPFSKVAFGFYCYQLRDTITASGDTLCLIHFNPKPGKPFDGFIGTAITDTKTGVIHQIIAQSTQYNPQEPLLVVNQRFERLKGNWLPAEKTITVSFNQGNSANQKEPSAKEQNFIAESSTNIYQQEINPPLQPEDFKTVTETGKMDPATNTFIYRPIDQKDLFSQQAADSALIVSRQKQQLKLIRLMAEGKIPMGYFDINYNRLFGYNLYEGFKLGIEGESNLSLSKYFTVGGYLSYAFKDQSLINGEWLDVFPSGRPDYRIHLDHKDRNMEYGEPEFLESNSLLNPESFRTLLTKNMYATNRYAAGLEFRPYEMLSLYLFGDHSDNRARVNSSFLLEHPFDPITLMRTGLKIRYSPGAKFQMEDGHLEETTSPGSDFYLTVLQGLTAFDGEYRYTKIELKWKYILPFSKYGTTTVMVRGGTMSKSAPMIEFFNGYGSFAGTFSLAAPYSFATMQLNEFAAANYTAIHLRHDFSPWLFPEKFKKRPAFVFAQNMGVGQLDNLNQERYHLPDYRKGFYESGFEVNNLLRTDYLSWGVGVYYRYGPYQFGPIHENFAYKFGFFFNL
jgi:hypothetical protein